MKIMGVVGSHRPSEVSGVHKHVSTVLENTGIDYELVHLRGKKIQGCISCMGCVEDNVCVVDDDMKALRPLILEADAYVIGAPNFYSAMNANTRSFLERWYQFRHQTGDALWGKLAVSVGVGGADGVSVVAQLNAMLMYSFIDPVAEVVGQGAASCFTCGYGETCQVGLPVLMYGPDVKIVPEMIPDVRKQQDVMDAAVSAGKVLGDRLRDGHDRKQVALKVQQTMMEKFKSSS
jgi:multimeric flavodoxin WrbA